jgi:hypothetical protein
MFRASQILFLLLLSGVQLLALIMPGRVSAADTSAAWVDNFNLSYEGSNYQSDDENDDWVFYRVGDPDGCPDEINDIDWSPYIDGADKVDDPGDDDTSAKYTKSVPDVTGCLKDDSINIDLTDSTNATRTLFWNGEFIQTKSAGPKIFQKRLASTESTGFTTDDYVRVDVNEDDKCIDTIRATVGSNTGVLTVRVKEDSRGNYTDGGKTQKIAKEDQGEENSGLSYISNADYDNIANKCYVSESFEVTLYDVQTASEPGTGTSTGGSLTTIDLSLDGTNDNPTCESSGFSLSWIFCPIVNAALDTMDWMFRTVIEPFLIFTPLSTEPGSEIYEIWKSFRTIGNILLVFGLLFVVFGQSIGGGLVDAYTAKKAMPRILAAAILINLSFFIVAFLVDIVNVIGMGIGQLMTAPLGDNGSFNFTLNGLISGGGVLALLLGGTWLVGLLTSGTGFLLILFLSVILPMLLVVIAIFATLVIRRGLIIVLAIFSPIALALYVLPNTEKYAKKWLDLLIKTLMVYPIIIVIFAVADILSVLMSNASSGFIDESITQFVSLIILFIPFFMIPFAFKLAGGAIATISGAVTSMGKKRLEHFKGNELDQHSRLNKAKASFRDTRNIGARKRGAWLESRSDKASGKIPKALIGANGEPLGPNDFETRGGRRAYSRWRQRTQDKRGYDPDTHRSPGVLRSNPEGGVGADSYGPKIPGLLEDNSSGGVGEANYGPSKPAPLTVNGATPSPAPGVEFIPSESRSSRTDTSSTGTAETPAYTPPKVTTTTIPKNKLVERAREAANAAESARDRANSAATSAESVTPITQSQQRPNIRTQDFTKRLNQEEIIEIDRSMNDRFGGDEPN